MTLWALSLAIVIAVFWLTKLAFPTWSFLLGALLAALAAFLRFSRRQMGTWYRAGIVLSAGTAFFCGIAHLVVRSSEVQDIPPVLTLLAAGALSSSAFATLLTLYGNHRSALGTAGTLATLSWVIASAALLARWANISGFNKITLVEILSFSLLSLSAVLQLITIRRKEMASGRLSPQWAVVAALLAGLVLTGLATWVLARWQKEALLAQTQIEASATAQHTAILLRNQLQRVAPRDGRPRQIDHTVSPGLVLYGELQGEQFTPIFLVEDPLSARIEELISLISASSSSISLENTPVLRAVTLPNQRTVIIAFWKQFSAPTTIAAWDAEKFFEPVTTATINRQAALTVYLYGRPILQAGEAAREAPSALASVPTPPLSLDMFEVEIRLGPARVLPFQTPLPYLIGAIGLLSTVSLSLAFHLAWRRTTLAQMLSQINAQLHEEIEERRQVEKLLAEREARLQALLHQLPAIVWTVDHDLIFTSSSGRALADLGLHPHEVVGMSLFEYFGTESPEHPAIEAHRRALTGETQEFEFVWQDHWYQVRLDPLTDQEGNIIGVVGVAFDVSEQKQIQHELERLATTDELTGLLNRAAVLTQLEHHLRTHHPFALLLVDLDGFKMVNDSLGHLVGDAVLRQLAGRLRSIVRQSDLVGRLGGDEFVILVSDLTTEKAKELAGRVILALSQPYVIEGHSLTLGGSVGMVLYQGEENLSATELLRRADLALYDAKRRGKGRLSLFREELEESSLFPLERDIALRTAVHEKAISLVAYPVVELRNGRVRGISLTPQVQHPSIGRLEGRDLVRAVEQVGLEIAVGVHFLDQVASWLEIIMAADTEALVILTYPTRSFAEPELLEGLQTLRLRWPKGTFWLDLPAPALLDPEIKAVVRHLAQAHIATIVSDPVLSQEGVTPLVELPLAGLRLPASTIQRLLIDEVAAVLTRALLDVARDLGLTSLAEGIAELAHIVALVRSGCPLGSGPLFQAIEDPHFAAHLLEWRPHWSEQFSR